MRPISDCYLYGILDLGYVAPERACEIAAKMIEGGVDVLQLRAKTVPQRQIQDLGGELLQITEPAGVLLIINDHPQLVSTIGAQGAHVGQDDRPVTEARALASSSPPEGERLTTRSGIRGRVLIGNSTHSVNQALAAAAEGADYIGFGPLFSTPTKPDYTPIGTADIRRVHELVRIPIFCIGGIKLENLSSVLAAGARRVVIVSGILQAADIVAYTRAVKAMLACAEGSDLIARLKAG